MPIVGKIVPVSPRQLPPGLVAAATEGGFNLPPDEVEPPGGGEAAKSSSGS
jgi:hypothetical protein